MAFLKLHTVNSAGPRWSFMGEDELKNCHTASMKTQACLLVNQKGLLHSQGLQIRQNCQYLFVILSHENEINDRGQGL